MKKLLFWRRLCQIAILIFFVLVPVLNIYELHGIYGNLLAFNFFDLQLIDPLSALQVLIGIFSSASPLPIASEMLWGAFWVLLIAFLLGPIFCGWLCPYGLFSEIVWRLHSKKQQNSKNSQAVKKTFFAQRFTIKCLVFAILLAFALFLQQGPILNQLSLPAWYTRVWQNFILFGEVLLYPILFICIMLVLEFIFKKRFWCLYICPQSVLITLSGALSSCIFPRRLRVSFTQKSCTCAKNERACVAACSLNLNPRGLSGMEKITCMNCGDCVAACHKVCKVEKKALNLIMKHTLVDK